MRRFRILAGVTIRIFDGSLLPGRRPVLADFVLWDRAYRVMNRVDRAFALAVMIAVCLLAGSPSLAGAAGYWSCSGGKWIAVGNPHHAMPSKTCGFQMVIPRTQAACEQSGGRWGPAGLFPQPICKMPTHDGGHVCADTGECEALCLAALTPAQRDLLGNRRKLKLLGKCATVAPLFGCLAIVNQGYVTGLECRD
jgi:hypothetical protein